MNARLRLAFAGETMFPPPAPFFGVHGSSALGLPAGEAGLRPWSVVHRSVPST
jgi:hypothetical protein